MNGSDTPPSRALLIDLDGVVYDADETIAGAVDTLAWLEEQGTPYLFLTNTTSRPRAALVEKLGWMGIRATEPCIVTPSFAASRWLKENTEGRVALFVAESAVDEFSGLEIVGSAHHGSVAAVVIGDYGEGWSFAELNRAFRLLMAEPNPMLVALGMTRYWRAADGLRLDTAPFVVALEHATGVAPIVLGKPAKPFFDMALAELGTPATETWMIGDDISSDIAGAQRAGLRGALVRTGKFRPRDLELDIDPDAVLESIAELPAWWQEVSG